MYLELTAGIMKSWGMVYRRERSQLDIHSKNWGSEEEKSENHKDFSSSVEMGPKSAAHRSVLKRQNALSTLLYMPIKNWHGLLTIERWR